MIDEAATDGTDHCTDPRIDGEEDALGTGPNRVRRFVVDQSQGRCPESAKGESVEHLKGEGEPRVGNEVIPTYADHIGDHGDQKVEFRPKFSQQSPRKPKIRDLCADGADRGQPQQDPVCVQRLEEEKQTNQDKRMSTAKDQRDHEKPAKFDRGKALPDEKPEPVTK